MIPYDLDPSLHTGEPEAQTLGDGFSPPPHDAHEGDKPRAAAPATPGESALREKSAF
jgi:hypothetical protein